MQAYGCHIFPVRDRAEWTRTNGVDVNPPYAKQIGRPRRNRRKQPEELEEGTRLSRHGVQMRCSYCRKPDHNIKGCAVFKEDVRREEESKAAQEGAQQSGHGEGSAEGVQDPVEPRPKRRRTNEQVIMQDVPRVTREFIVDEHGDEDDPSILEHINPTVIDLTMDPTNVQGSVVPELINEVPRRMPQQFVPIPEESSFVGEYRDSIPPARVTTATTEGMAILRGRTRTRGRPRGTAAGRGETGTRGRGSATSTTGRGTSTGTGGRGRGRGAGKGRSAGTGTGRSAGSGRGRAAGSGSGTGRQIGRDEWLLFGENGAAGPSNLGVGQEGAEAVEVNNTQGAPLHDLSLDDLSID